jgi:hypothetical protein
MSPALLAESKGGRTINAVALLSTEIIELSCLVAGVMSGKPESQGVI